MFPGDDHRELFSSFGWIFFSPRCTGSFLLHIHCSVPCQELKIDCGPQSNLSVCAALTPLSVLSLLSLPRLLSVSTQRVHWVLPAPPSLCCCLESICRQFVGEIPGLPSSVVSSPRDHSFIAWCSMSSKPVFYLLFPLIPTHTLRQILLIAFYRWVDQDSEKFRNFPEFTNYKLL